MTDAEKLRQIRDWALDALTHCEHEMDLLIDCDSDSGTRAYERAWAVSESAKHVLKIVNAK